MHNRRIVVRLGIAECPICGDTFIVLQSDIIHDRVLRCDCGFMATISDWMVEDDRTVILYFRENDVKVKDDL